MKIDGRPGVENAITGYIHCRVCVAERIRAKIGVGFTAGNEIQIWCENHDINVALIEVESEETV